MKKVKYFEVLPGYNPITDQVESKPNRSTKVIPQHIKADMRRDRRCG